MANIFGILTALVVAVSLWVGYKNGVELEKQVVATAAAERKLKTAQEDEQTINAKNKAEDKRFAEFPAELEEAKLRPEELEIAINELTVQKNSLEKKVKRSSRELASIEEARSSFPDPEVVIPEITKTKQDIAQLKVDLASEQAELETVEAEIVSVNAVSAKHKEINEVRASGKSLPTLATTVKSVYRNWGFVTLNGGNTQGVVPGSTLDVVRNGEVVAKLKVTAVESNRAAADILPDALPVVVSLRAGDKVVAAK